MSEAPALMAKRKIPYGLLFLLKLALTAGCLWWAFSKVDWHNTVFVRRDTLHTGWLLASVILGGAAVFFAALRWWLLVRAQGIPAPLVRIVRHTLIGNLFGLISLGGLGNGAARVMLLLRDHPAGKLRATTTVLVDQLASLVGISLLFFVFTPSFAAGLADPGVLERGVLRFAWCYFGGGMIGVVILFILSSPPVSARIHPKTGGRIWQFTQRLPVTYDIYRKKWRHSLCAVLVSTVVLFSYYLSFWCAVRAVGGGATPLAVVSAMPVIDGLSSLPVSVAGVGVREKLFQVLLGREAGMGSGTAVAASLAGFLCQLAWAPLGAWLFLKKDGGRE